MIIIIIITDSEPLRKPCKQGVTLFPWHQSLDTGMQL
jgi:hypothetical protein